MKIPDFVCWLLSEDLGGSEQEPGSQQKLFVRESIGGKVEAYEEIAYEELTDPNRRGLLHCFSACNSGYDIGIGTPNKWHVILHGAVARRLAWFILWNWWAKGTWFGLKRFIYHRANSAIVRRFKQEGQHHGASK